jgi:hypothetical protein
VLAHRDMTGTWTVPLAVLRIIEPGHGRDGTGNAGHDRDAVPPGCSARNIKEIRNKKGCRDNTGTYPGHMSRCSAAMPARERDGGTGHPPPLRGGVLSRPPAHPKPAGPEDGGLLPVGLGGGRIEANAGPRPTPFSTSALHLADRRRLGATSYAPLPGKKATQKD